MRGWVLVDGLRYPDPADEPSVRAAGGLTAFAAQVSAEVFAAVEHSVDDVTYADLVTWTGQTAAPTAVRRPVTGTINRYVKTTWAFTGTGSGQSLTAMVALARG